MICQNKCLEFRTKNKGAETPIVFLSGSLRARPCSKDRELSFFPLAEDTGRTEGYSTYVLINVKTDQSSINPEPLYLKRLSLGC